MLSADFGHLERDCRMVNRSAAGWFHLDVMDGIFVPNISFGFPICQAIARVATKPLDAHLMIIEPWSYVERFAKLGFSVVSAGCLPVWMAYCSAGRPKASYPMGCSTLNPFSRL